MTQPAPTLERVSVVIPAFRAWDTIPRVLDALRPQVERDDREAILVDSTGDGRAGQLALDYPWLDVVALPSKTLPGRARNLAVQRASGALVAFLDADAVPGPGWLDSLLGSLDDGADAVAGAVLNGTPGNVVGTAGYFLEFVEWHPQRRGEPGHGATCNLLIRRDALEAAGGFREDLFPGEDTILTFRLAQAGRLSFARSAQVRHLNRTSPGEFLRHQVRLGACFADICAQVDFPHRRLGRPSRAPLAAALRLGALGLRVASPARTAVEAVVVSPALIAGLAAWAYGLARS